MTGSRTGGAGLRVVEFSHVWAGPYCGQILSDLGAEVIKVESRSHLDVHRRAGPYVGEPDIDGSGVWNAQNRGKKSCTLNLKRAEGSELARRLLEQADVVLENYSPGTLDRLGLGYESLAARHPAIVMVSLSGYGLDGPKKHFPAYGPMMDAAGGLTWAARDETGRPQSVNGWLPDTSSALYGAVAALTGAALAARTGRGRHYDISQLETTCSLLPEMFAVAGAGTGPDLRGNVVPGSLLCVPLRCRDEGGAEAWVVLELADRADWRVVADVLGCAPPPDDPAVGPAVTEQALARLRAELGSTVRGMGVDNLCVTLQSRGVKCLPVSSAADLLSSAHLAERGGLVDVIQPDRGMLRTYAPAVRPVGGGPRGELAPAPRMGEHNGYVFEQILGLPPERRADLERAEVIW